MRSQGDDIKGLTFRIDFRQVSATDPDTTGTGQILMSIYKVPSQTRIDDAGSLPIPFSISEDAELRGKGWRWIMGIPRLALAHHVNHFDADPVVEILALADADRFQCSSRPAPQAALGIAGGDRPRLSWLPSMTMLSGLPWRSKALRRKRFVAGRSRYSLNQNSTVSPTVSMAR